MFNSRNEILLLKSAVNTDDAKDLQIAEDTLILAGTPITPATAGPIREAIEYTSAAPPVAGTFVLGDRIWNSAPASAAPMGWICTTPGVAGVDAVFTAMANLA